MTFFFFFQLYNWCNASFVPHAETLQQKLSLRAIHKLLKEKTNHSLGQSEVHLRYDSWNADLKDFSSFIYHLSFQSLIEISVFHSSESLAKIHRRKTSADRFCGITSKLSDVMPSTFYSSWEDPEAHPTSTNIQSRSRASSRLHGLNDHDQCFQWHLSGSLTAWFPVSAFISDIVSSSSKASWLYRYMLDFDIQKWIEP